jgi:HEXXH motif-containing protein
MELLAFARRGRVEESVRALLAAAGGGNKGGARFPYFEALNQIQNRTIRLDDLERPPKAVFEYGHPDDRRIIEHFLEGEDVSSDHLFDEADRESTEERFADGLTLLEAFDPYGRELAETLIARFLFARKQGFGGASTGDMLGCVWLSPPRRWEAVDFAEAIHHESVHQALFLEEMVHGVYSVPQPELGRGEALVVSAIRRERRPFDASFHAACVAAALVDLYQRLERPERVEPLVEGLTPSVEEMAEKESYLTEGGRQILREVELRVG